MTANQQLQQVKCFIPPTCHISEGSQEDDKSSSQALKLSFSNSIGKRGAILKKSYVYHTCQGGSTARLTFCTLGVSTYGGIALESRMDAAEDKTEKIGVLLLNLGGPDTLCDVQPFLFNLFADPDIIRLPRLFRFLQRPLAKLIYVLRAPKSKEGYATIGGGSPLRKITYEQAEAIKLVLEEKEVDVNVYVGMQMSLQISDKFENKQSLTVTHLVKKRPSRGIEDNRLQCFE